MPESTESKQTERAVFIPQTMGIFILLIIILSFITGAVRQELVLTLIGAVFLAVWAYCLFMTLLLALIHRRNARKISIRVSPRELTAGEQAGLIYSPGGSFRLPGILVRCRVLLSTKDGRRIRHDFDPAMSGAESFEVRKRGAYFSDYDEFALFDALGFFRFAFRIPQGSDARLLASPRAAEEPTPVRARAGESNQKLELTFQRTDNLIDHRPYVPGDDPRRINWKLYGHGGELFVREGEREPPPHSNILILVDTQFDSLLYSAKSARRGIDMLCENALAAALAVPVGLPNAGADSGMNALIGFTDGTGKTACLGGNSSAELAAALAWPAARPLPSAAELPLSAKLTPAPEDRGIIVFALPRAAAESSALDRFLRDHASCGAERNKAQIIELIFLYGSDTESGGTVAYNERAAAAETCAAMYNHRPGVRARAIGV